MKAMAQNAKAPRPASDKKMIRMVFPLDVVPDDEESPLSAALLDEVGPEEDVV